MNKYQKFFASIGLIDSQGLAQNNYDEDDILDGNQFFARVKSKSKNHIDCFLEISCKDAVEYIQKTTNIKPIFEKDGSSKFWTFNIKGYGNVIVENYKGRSNYMAIVNQPKF